jgi:KaiC/GvpD/RAD55 family RecA-like ATPase
MLTSQGRAGDHNLIMEAALEFEVDSILVLYHSKRKGERIRALEILKMRGTKIPDKTFEVVIDENGLSITSKTVEI